MKKYVISADNKKNKIGMIITVLNHNLPDAMKEVKEHINKTFTNEVSNNFVLTPDPLLCGTVVY